MMEKFQAEYNSMWDYPHVFVEGGHEYEFDTGVCDESDTFTDEEAEQLSDGKHPWDLKLKFVLNDSEYDEPLEVSIYDALNRLKIKFVLHSVDIANLRDFFDSILFEE